MHANTKELIRIKDGKKSPFDQHVLDCSVCQDALQCTIDIQGEMQQMFTKAPDNVWNKIKSEHIEKQQIKQSSRLVKAIYTLAATIMITAGLVTFLYINNNNRNDELYQNMSQLMASSRTLESMIALQINNGDMANESVYQNDKLKWRLLLIDQEIQMTMSGDVEHHISLWQDRIRTLQAMSQNLKADYSTQQL